MLDDLKAFMEDLHEGLKAFVHQEISYDRDGTRIAIQTCTVVPEIRVRFGNNDLEEAYRMCDIEIPLDDLKPIWELKTREQRIGAICVALKTSIDNEIKRREEARAQFEKESAEHRARAERETYERLKKKFEGEDA